MRRRSTDFTIAVPFVTVPPHSFVRHAVELTRVDGEKNTLHYAILGGNAKVVHFLVMKGFALLRLFDENGDTPFLLACKRGFYQGICVIAANGVRIARDPKLTIDGGTPLHAAAESGNEEAVAYLLRREANPGACPDPGRGRFFFLSLFLSLPRGNLALISPLPPPMWYKHQINREPELRNADAAHGCR